MTKFHINSKGLPAECKATIGNCPFGGAETHFNSSQEAQDFADTKNMNEFGLLGNQNKYEVLSNNSTFVDQHINEIITPKRNLGYEDFYDKGLECHTFDEFSSKYAKQLVKHKSFKGSKNIAKEAEELWKSIHYHNSSKDLYELSEEEAIQVVKDNLNPNYVTGWFRAYDSGYKPHIENAIITNPKLRNASLNISHRVYQESTGNNVSFQDFINMDIDVYRGGNFEFIDKDVFVSYSFNKNTAEGFVSKHNNNLVKRTVKIKDTLGSLQTTGEAEIMIRR